MAKHTEKPARMDGNSLSPQKELLASLKSRLKTNTVQQMELAKMNKTARKKLEGLEYGI